VRPGGDAIRYTAPGAEALARELAHELLTGENPECSGRAEVAATP
jgi:hypothetical protein